MFCEDVFHSEATVLYEFDRHSFRALLLPSEERKKIIHDMLNEAWRTFLFSPSFQLLESVVPGEETAINRTCLAALLSEKGTVEGITEQEKKKLKKALKDAMLHYRHQLNKTQRRNAKSPRRALIRMILFYLHSTRDQATNLQIAVSNKVLDKVKEFVQQFNREFLVNCSMRDKALFCNAYGDLLTRKGQYEEGW